MRRAQRLRLWLLVAGWLGLAGCAAAAPPKLVLPLTVAAPTVDAWQYGPVTTRLQAAIGAQRKFIHIHFVQSPQVIFVERLDSTEAQRRLRTMPVDVPGADAWLVILEGDFQGFGPPPAGTPSLATATPIPTVHGCVYVLLAAADGASYRSGPTSCLS
jgi:hypothetical protein